MLVSCHSPSKVNILADPLCFVLGHGVCKAICCHWPRRVLEGVACHISISLWASGKVNAAKSRVLVFDKLGGSEFQVNRKWFHHHISHQCLCSHRSVEYFQSDQQKLITAGIVHRFCVVWQDGVLQTHPHHPPVLAEAGQSFWTSRSWAVARKTLQQQVQAAWPDVLTSVGEWFPYVGMVHGVFLFTSLSHPHILFQ